MPKGKVPKAIWVSPAGKEWRVHREGASRAIAKLPTKEAAVRRGRAVAKPEKGQLKIQRRDGTIQKERTYGHDPERSPG